MGSGPSAAYQAAEARKVKFVYEYRTKDNVRHTGEISAASRDAVFAALRAQGIRPGCVNEAPGFFNKLLGKYKRWMAIVLLAMIAGVAGLSAVRAEKEVRQSVQGLDDAARRQIIGDSAVIEKGIRTGWIDTFDLDGDRFLASFAIPGYAAAIRNTTEKAFREAIETSCQMSDSDSMEKRQIKAIVEGMKVEIRDLLSKGWTVSEVGTALAKRQDREIQYYQNARTELDRARDAQLDERAIQALWEKRNAELRNMGIRLLAMPD